MPQLEALGPDAARLRAQADRLEAAMRRHQREAEELRAEVVDLRVQADRLEREPVTIMAATAPPMERDTITLDKVTAALEAGADTSTAIAEHAGVSVPRARAALARLEEVGAVVRTGIKRGTRYRLAKEEAPAPAEHRTVREFGNYSTAIRDAAIKLDTFGIEDLQAELSDVSEHTLRRWLRHFEARGVLTSDRIDGRKVWAYERARGSTPARRRHETPEAEAHRTAGKVTTRRRGSVAGTGRGMRAGVPIVDALLREVRAFPKVKVERRSHKFAFLIDGREVASCSSTPGASSLAGTRGELRKAGIPVKP